MLILIQEYEANFDRISFSLADLIFEALIQTAFNAEIRNLMRRLLRGIE